MQNRFFKTRIHDPILNEQRSDVQVWGGLTLKDLELMQYMKKLLNGERTFSYCQVELLGKITSAKQQD